jgi:hypothetical protein
MGKRQIVEGGCEETFLSLIQTKEKCAFTVPPAVALLNYISRGLLWWIFSQTGIFAGFSLNTINFAVYLCTSLSACLDFGDFSSNSDLYNINMHGTLYF